MTYKAPTTIRFPAVPGSTPPSWPGAATPDELVTEKAISVPRPAVRDRANLTLLTGPSAGEVFALAAIETISGRDEEAALRPEDPAVSRQHAKITREASGE